MGDLTQPIVVLSSGGKDSVVMLHRLQQDPRWTVRALVTTVNESNGRVAMHGTPEALIRAQAESLDLPLTLIGLPEDCDNAEYERRLSTGLAPLRAEGIGHVACGDLFLADIRQWREDLFERLGWSPLFPLWHEPTDRLAQALIDDGWKLTITCVDTRKLPPDLLGSRFDHEFLGALPDAVDPCGENGEFHTFVHDGPAFSRALDFVAGEMVMLHEHFAVLDLEPIH